ncbi:MAG: DUF2891 family protein, partial [Halobacteriaceae archaeon]
MNPTEVVGVETIVSGRSNWIGSELAEQLARHPLDSVDTEFPHHVSSMESPDDVTRPREQHPVFFGCYDWHSSVHSHWALIRQVRLIDDHPLQSQIIESVDHRFTEENFEREVKHFEENETFEKPYGWAWLLHLAAELSLWEDERADEWQSLLAPLEKQITTLVESNLLTENRAFRVGTHQNTAFALGCILDYARVKNDDSLESAVTHRAIDLFGDDEQYPVEYEPLGWDFLSPALVEADLMRRVYAEGEFVRWIDDFFPDVTRSPY